MSTVPTAFYSGRVQNGILSALTSPESGPGLTRTGKLYQPWGEAMNSAARLSIDLGTVPSTL